MQPLDNNRPGPRPDGLDVFKGLDAAIREHAVATKELAGSVKVAVGDSGAVSFAWYQGAANGLSIGLIAGLAIGLVAAALFTKKQ